MYLHISTIDGKDLIENSLLMYSNQVLIKYFVDIFFQRNTKVNDCIIQKNPL